MRNKKTLTSLRRQMLLNGAEKNKDSSNQRDSSTFDENLRVTLLLPDHALVCCVIRQVALVDSERPLVAHALEHIPDDDESTYHTEHKETNENRSMSNFSDVRRGNNAAHIEYTQTDTRT